MTNTAENTNEAVPLIIGEPANDKPVDLFVEMGRQANQYFTTPDWPTLEEQTLPTAFIMRHDGLWERRINNVGVFVAQKAAFTVPGFPKETNHEGFVLRHGQIPYELLQEIVFFFKAICDDSKDEVYMQILYSLEAQVVDGKEIPAGVYFNHCPTQVVSGSSVEFTRNVELEAKNVLALEIHSHNTMGAFFSGVDDRDEKGDRLFGVVGNLDKFNPQMLFSFVCGGKRVLVKSDDIFTKPLDDPFPKGWRGSVSKRGTATSSYQGSSYYTGQQAAYAASQGWKAQEQKTTSGGSTSPGTGGSSYQGGVGRAWNWYNDFEDDDEDKRASVSSQSSPEEIKKAVERAAEEALSSIDNTLKSRDFMKDATDSKLVDAINSEVLKTVVSTPHTIVRPSAAKLEKTVESEVSTVRPFFHQAATELDRASDEVDAQIDIWRNEREIEAFDAILQMEVQKIKLRFLNQKYLDDEMTDDQKQALFQDLCAHLESKDLVLLTSTIIDMGHAEEVMVALEGSEPESVVDLTTESGV